jgi:hypothetical protein
VLSTHVLIGLGFDRPGFSGDGLSASTHVEDVHHDSRDGDVSGKASEKAAELLSALTGREANRERVVAHQTRRVVLSSLGVLKEQKETGSRARARALAVTVVLLLLIGPLLWEAIDSLIAGEHLADPGSQLSLFAVIVCPTLLAAALVAGWWRHRS